MASRKSGRSGKQVHLLVGTRKGGFLFRSDRRRKKWTIGGPVFPGWEVNHLIRDPRSGRLFAAINHPVWGGDMQVGSPGGKRWRKASAGLSFANGSGLSIERIWQVTPDRPSRPDTLWCGVAPGALFRTDDGGKNWDEVKALTTHPTRSQWQPGAAGLCLHTILPDPRNSDRIFVGISAAGCFRSDDDGASWTPANRGVRADFLPNKLPEVGQCVHKMALHPEAPDVLFQQNHCGVYRSENAGETWKDISRGLPSRFGFPIAVHPHEPKTVFVVPETSDERRYTPQGRLAVYRSTNAGRSWTALGEGLPKVHAYLHVLRDAMTTDSCDEAGIYLGTAAGEIYGSTDGGERWKLVHGHLPTILSLEAAVV